MKKLSMLVDKSLVVAEESWESGARYRLLEPVRQYSREKLEESEEEEQTRYRHAEWYLTLAEEAEKESNGPGFQGWLDRLETERDNLRAALRWSLDEGDAELGLRLAGTLWLFWFTRGHSLEGWGWLEKRISLGGSPAAKAKALNGAGWITMWQGEPRSELTRREQEVALLVARGLTDRQVSTKLSISERTAGNHVATILRKLGVRSRAQIATWATERQLLTPADPD
jgi:DNA-binding CsgD family transcriptional regulator